MTLPNPFDHHWLTSLPIALGGAFLGDVLARLARIDWGPDITAIGLAITVLGGAAIGLYRQWKLTQIEIAERAQAQAQARRLREPPADQVNPGRTPNRVSEARH